jgi:hypothetical protein
MLRLHRLTFGDLALGVVLRHPRSFVIAADHDAATLALHRVDLAARLRTGEV